MHISIRLFALVALVAVAVAVAGCRRAPHDHGHAHDDEQAHEHEHEAETAQVTVWSGGYEVFVEHQAPVAGKGTTFITHVTDLETLEPRREGKVTYVPRQGDTVVEHSQPAPDRDGIYLPDIVFPSAGEWGLTLRIPSGGTDSSVDLGTVQVYEDEHVAAHAKFSEAPEGVSFLKEQQWKIRVDTEPATRRRLVERLRVPGRVRAKPGLSADVVAPLSGQLIAPADFSVPKLGGRVEAGQLLAQLEPNFSETAAKVAEAEAEFKTAKAALEQAEAAYARTKKLAEVEAKSAREVQEAELLYQSAQARYAAAAGLLGTFKQAGAVQSPEAPLLMELRAPIAGVLNSVSAGSGEVVAAGQKLFTVLNPETVWIEAAVPESDVGRLSSAKDAALERPGDRGQFRPVTGAGEGELLAVGLAVDPETRTLPLIYETANAEGQLRIGENVTLYVETARVEEAVAVPDSALIEEGGLLIAFVQLSGEIFEKREIRAGIRDTGLVQILSGIKEGERVVTSGAYAIRLSSISGAIPAHGHAH